MQANASLYDLHKYNSIRLFKFLIFSEPTTPENRDKTDFLTKIRGYFNSISGVQVRTNRIVSIFKSKNAGLYLFYISILKLA